MKHFTTYSYFVFQTQQLIKREKIKFLGQHLAFELISYEKKIIYIKVAFNFHGRWQFGSTLNGIKKVLRNLMAINRFYSQLFEEM